MPDGHEVLGLGSRVIERYIDTGKLYRDIYFHLYLLSKLIDLSFFKIIRDRLNRE